MTHLSRTKRLVGVVATGALVLATPGTASAAAPGSVIVRVKTAKVVGASASRTDQASGVKTVVRIVANFTSHTTNSVKLTTFKICYSDSGGEAILVTPEINVGGKRVWGRGETRYSGGGDCTKSYVVNKKFTGKPGKEMFVIKTNVGLTPNTFLHGYNR